MPVELPCNTSDHTKLRLCGIDAFRAFPGIFQFAGALLVHVPGNPETLGSAFHWPIRCLLCPETAVPKVSDKKCAKKYQTLIRRLFQVCCPTLTTVQQTCDFLWRIFLFFFLSLSFFFLFEQKRRTACWKKNQEEKKKQEGNTEKGRRVWWQRAWIYWDCFVFSFRKNSLITKNLEMQRLF